MGVHFGAPQRILATVGRIRELAKRDGRNFVWERPDGHATRTYHGAVMFSTAAYRHLRHTEATDVSHFETRLDSGGDRRRYRVHTIHANPPTSPGNRVVNWALQQLGTPYVFGAQNGPDDVGKDSFDCSGLTAEGWSTEGVTLIHSAEGQRTSALVDRFYDQVKCEQGDLVFMNFPNTRGIEPPHASHVGFWYRPGFMIDTRNPDGEPVAVRPIELGNVVAYGRVRV
jgi:cell wall-associated NlpC family hydrolase